MKISEGDFFCKDEIMWMALEEYLELLLILYNIHNVLLKERIKT